MEIGAGHVAFGCGTPSSSMAFSFNLHPSWYAAELASVQARVHDANLRHTLSFGIGLHHAGLDKQDKALVESLFANLKIQVRF